MSGIKARSGRKSKYYEAREGDVLSICNEWLIENFHSFDHDTKLRVALAISPRGVQQKFEHTGNITFIDSLKQSRSRIPLELIPN